MLLLLLLYQEGYGEGGWAAALTDGGEGAEGVQAVGRGWGGSCSGVQGQWGAGWSEE